LIAFTVVVVSVLLAVSAAISDGTAPVSRLSPRAAKTV